MKTPETREIYKLRQLTVELAIGDLKENQGLLTFLTRGIQGAKIEFNLEGAARNLRTIWLYPQ